MILEIGFNNMHALLQNLYNDMLPLVDSLTGVAKGIAGIGALLYVSYRVWQALARSEPIDVFPLLRPFVVGICIMFFPTIVLGSLNGILNPIVKGCHGLLEEQVFDMNDYQAAKDKAEIDLMKQCGLGFIADDKEFDEDIERLGWRPEGAAVLGAMYQIREMFSLRSLIFEIMRSILEFIFEAAALVIDTIRTFFLIVLAVLGPIAFAISNFDGFQPTLVHWMGKYVSVYLWLPISDLFSAILSRVQTLTLQYDIDNMATNPFAETLSGGAALLFLVIGIVGYFTIPSVATWVVQTSGLGSYLRGVNGMASGVTRVAGAAAGAASGNIAGGLIH